MPMIRPKSKGVVTLFSKARQQYLASNAVGEVFLLKQGEFFEAFLLLTRSVGVSIIVSKMNGVVVILGSGPNAMDAAGWSCDAYDQLVAINNAWRVPTVGASCSAECAPPCWLLALNGVSLSSVFPNDHFLAGVTVENQCKTRL